MLFYRTDLMEAAGIDEASTTWEEGKTAAEKMTTAETFGLTIPSWGEMTWTMWGWMLAEAEALFQLLRLFRYTIFPTEFFAAAGD